jgi:hypothetical protein
MLSFCVAQEVYGCTQEGGVLDLDDISCMNCLSRYYVLQNCIHEECLELINRCWYLHGRI